MTALQKGDRVKRADANPNSIPAYRDMRGTVVGFEDRSVRVMWDCDKGHPPSLHKPSDLALADGGES